MVPYLSDLGFVFAADIICGMESSLSRDATSSVEEDFPRFAISVSDTIVIRLSSNDHRKQIPALL